MLRRVSLLPLLLLLPLASAFAPAARHNVHVSNARMAVEGTEVIVQVRLYKDDLATALSNLAGHPVTLAGTDEMNALGARYLNRHLLVNAGGRVLVGRVVGSEPDDLMWAYTVEYAAPTAVRSLILTNRLLFDLYDDQRNLLKVMCLPVRAHRVVLLRQGRRRVPDAGVATCDRRRMVCDMRTTSFLRLPSYVIRCTSSQRRWRGWGCHCEEVFRRSNLRVFEP